MDAWISSCLRFGVNTGIRDERKEGKSCSLLNRFRFAILNTGGKAGVLYIFHGQDLSYLLTANSVHPKVCSSAESGFLLSTAFATIPSADANGKARFLLVVGLPQEHI